MEHYNLPHNHGQNIENVLEKMPLAEDFKDISFLFQQLGDPTRLRILWLLCHCECSRCITPSAYSKKERDYNQPQRWKRSLLRISRHASGKTVA